MGSEMPSLQFEARLAGRAEAATQLFEDDGGARRIAFEDAKKHAWRR